jgi:hypothetical protein
LSRNLLVASLGKFYAKPYKPAMQRKQMLNLRRLRGANKK